MSREQKEKLLRSEISMSFLLSKTKKGFWLSKITTLPEKVLDRILETVKEKNRLVNGYINIALQHDSDHLVLIELESAINLSKKDAAALDENVEKRSAESLLQVNLSQL